MPPQTEPLDTEVLPYGEAAIAEAARRVLAGEPVAVPTETVYGLAADAASAAAVARVFAAKGRPSFNPLIVHVGGLDEAEAVGVFDDVARALARRWWPGPLTLVVPLRPGAGIAPAVTAGLDTVALRSPAHPAMQDLLRACGRPLAAPSANASGGISPTCAAHVLKTLRGRIPLVIDGGETRRGLESTIVKVEAGGLRLLRPGPVAIADALASPPGREGIESPGMMASHYAPSKPLRLDASRADPDEWFIGYGAMQADDNLSPTADPEEAASRLFAALHRADASSKPRIAVAPVPAEGIGLAIADRLRRAAAPRPA
ncbi:MAG: threonylcarbamoyl-AMP synthase [Alphaproteobacteria bacterium]|nr:threonylcarbamoyl-AMP synthase [Alphaproteobacteria bacterium]MBV9371063.1 threonylcarbamoyl-AMP synthase [Alphaproteobacteria bacterium]MBV9901563.1 threonylcarbamoyl-AMP synthase [Alphaproteobacteria bacterium]